MKLIFYENLHKKKKHVILSLSAYIHRKRWDNYEGGVWNLITKLSVGEEGIKKGISPKKWGAYLYHQHPIYCLLSNTVHYSNITIHMIWHHCWN